MAEDIFLQYLLDVFITGIGAFVAVFIAFWFTRRQMFHPALQHIQSEYRAPEMLDALSQLWKLHDDTARDLGLTNRNNGRQITDEEKTELETEIMHRFETIYNQEELLLDRLSINIVNASTRRNINRNPGTLVDAMRIRDDAARLTFDNKRRLVSHFFLHLEVLLKNKILSKKQIRRTFPSSAETIRSISIPLEKKLVDIICNKRPWISDTVRQTRKRVTEKRLGFIADVMDGNPWDLKKIIFGIVIFVIVFILLFMGIFYYELNLKESASMLIGGAIGAFLGVLLEVVVFHRE